MPLVLFEQEALEPVDVIFMCLRKFYDVQPAEKWSEIHFLKNIDEQFFCQLTRDLDEAHSSLVAQNWKAATVVTASVMEALLAWWLKQKMPTPPDKLAKMIDEAAKTYDLFAPPSTHDPKYDRTEAESRKGAAMCAANYRNLTCSRASAWQAFGATLTVAEAIGSKLSSSASVASTTP